MSLKTERQREKKKEINCCQNELSGPIRNKFACFGGIENLLNEAKREKKEKDKGETEKQRGRKRGREQKPIVEA